jgi:hypothetical protein
MQNSLDVLAGDNADTATLKAGSSLRDFFSLGANVVASGGDDEETDEDEDDENHEVNNDEDPELDTKIVHSPLPTQTGGKP